MNTIDINSTSGRSNVIHHLERINIPYDQDLISEILDFAKTKNSEMTDDEIYKIASSRENASMSKSSLQ